jgi:hypothetical protein
MRVRCPGRSSLCGALLRICVKKPVACKFDIIGAKVYFMEGCILNSVSRNTTVSTFKGSISLLSEPDCSVSIMSG